MKTRIHLLLCYVLCFWVLLSCSSEAIFVDDPAGVLTKQQKERISNMHQALLTDLNIEFAVYISSEKLMDIDGQAATLFHEMEVGRSSETGKGLLFLVDPKGRQVRLEVGYNLEGIYPDSFIGYIERDQMQPFFSDNRVGTGVEAAVELLVARAMRKESIVGVDKAASEYLSGGGGAVLYYESDVKEKNRDENTLLFPAQDTPEKTLLLYKEVLQKHVKDPNLGIYSPESRTFLKQWTVTDAQQDNALHTLEGAADQFCTVEGDRAVISFPISQRELAPYFLVRFPEGWMLDFATMTKSIGFNHKNQYHFRTLQHPYAFAFRHLRFDKNGYPFE